MHEFAANLTLCSAVIASGRCVPTILARVLATRIFVTIEAASLQRFRSRRAANVAGDCLISALQMHSISRLPAILSARRRGVGQRGSAVGGDVMGSEINISVYYRYRPAHELQIRKGISRRLAVRFPGRSVFLDETSHYLNPAWQ